MEGEMEQRITLSNISLNYKLESIQGKTFYIPIQGITVIEGVSGKGKTSLLNVLLNTTQITQGQVTGNHYKYSAVFQEDRLIDCLSGVQNVKLVAPKLSYRRIEDELKSLLPASYINQEVSTYSKGMKRRVAIVRAMLSDSDIVVMDEPFAGLDEEMKKKTAAYVLQKLNKRTLILAVHDKEEARDFKPTHVISL
jgi:NitT/TauT family transport system ATP-binding protein